MPPKRRDSTPAAAKTKAAASEVITTTNGEESIADDEAKAVTDELETSVADEMAAMMDYDDYEGFQEGDIAMTSDNEASLAEHEATRKDRINKIRFRGGLIYRRMKEWSIEEEARALKEVDPTFNHADYEALMMSRGMIPVPPLAGDLEPKTPDTERQIKLFVVGNPRPPAKLTKTEHDLRSDSESSTPRAQKETSRAQKEAPKKKSTVSEAQKQASKVETPASGTETRPPTAKASASKAQKDAAIDETSARNAKSSTSKAKREKYASSAGITLVETIPPEDYPAAFLHYSRYTKSKTENDSETSAKKTSASKEKASRSSSKGTASTSKASTSTKRPLTLLTSKANEAKLKKKLGLKADGTPDRRKKRIPKAPALELEDEGASPKPDSAASKAKKLTIVNKPANSKKAAAANNPAAAKKPAARKKPAAVKSSAVAKASSAPDTPATEEDSEDSAVPKPRPNSKAASAQEDSKGLENQWNTSKTDVLIKIPAVDSLWSDEKTPTTTAKKSAKRPASPAQGPQRKKKRKSKSSRWEQAEYAGDASSGSDEGKRKNARRPLAPSAGKKRRKSSLNVIPRSARQSVSSKKGGQVLPDEKSNNSASQPVSNGIFKHYVLEKIQVDNNGDLDPLPSLAPEKETSSKKPDQSYSKKVAAFTNKLGSLVWRKTKELVTPTTTKRPREQSSSKVLETTEDSEADEPPTKRRRHRTGESVSHGVPRSSSNPEALEEQLGLPIRQPRAFFPAESDASLDPEDELSSTNSPGGMNTRTEIGSSPLTKVLPSRIKLRTSETLKKAEQVSSSKNASNAAIVEYKPGLSNCFTTSNPPTSWADERVAGLRVPHLPSKKRKHRLRSEAFYLPGPRHDNSAQLLGLLGLWPGMVYGTPHRASHIAFHYRTSPRVVSRTRDEAIDALWPGAADAFRQQKGVARKHGLDDQWALAAAVMLCGGRVDEGAVQRVCERNGLAEITIDDVETRGREHHAANVRTVAPADA